MSKSVNLLPDHPIVETRYRGEVSPELLSLPVRETIMACRNRGLCVQLFDDRERAIAWLME